MTTQTEQTGMEMLYRLRDIHTVCFDTEVVQQYNSVCDSLDLEPISDTVDWSTEFDIPQHYKEIDVEEYIKRLVPNAEGLDEKAGNFDRVEQELALYKARNLYPVLQLMIYIVDTLRKHNCVWGVGRGSSVASYCLYLIGVHKIDSIRYDLDIREFLK